MHDVPGAANPESVSRTANLLGATALAAADLMLAGISAATGLSASAAAAVVTLHGGASLSVSELGRRVGLSQPAATRMVDSLARGGLVTRRAAPGRAVAVSLTEAGRDLADRLLTARAEPLRELAAGLDERQRGALDELLGVLLTRLYQRVGSTELLCRLCDRACCVRGAECPVGAAARR